MAKKKYMTVLFEYEEGAILPQKLCASLAKKYEDTKIVAISLEDEFKRVEELENRAIEDYE